MIEKAFILFCEIILISTAIGGIAIILSATWYDLRAIAMRSQVRQVIKKLRRPRQPSIAMLVYLQNDMSSFEQCLKSILHSTYKNYHVVIVANGATALQMKSIHKYRRSHPKTSIKFYIKKISINRLAALQAGYKKIPACDLITVIDSTDTVAHTLLKNIAAHFIINPTLSALRVQHIETAPVTIGSLHRYFLHLSRDLHNKALSPFTVRSPYFGSAGTTITHAQFTGKQKHSKFISRYASDSIIKTNSLDELSDPPNIYGNIDLHLGILTTVLITYFLYTAATLQSNTFLVVSWTMVSLWLLAITWSNDQTGLSKKIELSVCTPVIYFVVYVRLLLHATTLILKYIRRHLATLHDTLVTHTGKVQKQT